MLLSKYCKDKNFTKEEYKSLQQTIKQKAIEIYNSTSETYGMYFPTFNIISESDIKPFIIQELKKIGMEFIEDYTLYRK